MNGLIKTSISCALLLTASQTFADWHLDNHNSQLSFVTTKAGNVAEVHSFDRLSGTVSQEGTTQIDIELASVNTLIDIRNDRMKSMLFETETFPKATLTTRIDLTAIEKMATGESTKATLKGVLDLHGQGKPVELNAVIVKLGDNRLLVTSWKPLIINAGDFKLVKGVEKLRAVAGLPSISNSVPVSFVLTFENR